MSRAVIMCPSTKPSAKPTTHARLVHLTHEEVCTDGLLGFNHEYFHDMVT